MLSPRSVLITGSNRGLGLEFVKRFIQLADPPKYIFAGCRNPDQAKELNELAKTNRSVIVVQLDVTNEDSINRAKCLVERTVDNGALNLLINNAALGGRRDTVYEVTKEEMMSRYEANVVGPLMVARSFIPLLQQASKEKHQETMSCSKAAIINISSQLGSISNNGRSGHYTYRPSKAALNMLTTNLCLDLKADGILCTAIISGWVRTAMGGQRATLSIEQSLDAVMILLGKLQGEKDSGVFYDAITGDISDW